MTENSKSGGAPLLALSFKAAMEATSLKKTFLRKSIRSGRLRAIKIGRRTVIRIADLEAFLESGQEIKPDKSRSDRRAKKAPICA